MIEASPRLLFVYGTLMSAAGGAMGRIERDRLGKESRNSAPAVAPGYLFDLGGYPGLVLKLPSPAARGAGRVLGELRELCDPDDVFVWLDRYEGIIPGTEMTAEYRRIVVEVAPLLSNAAKVRLPAWLYVYQGRLDGARLLPDGIWPIASTEPEP